MGGEFNKQMTKKVVSKEKFSRHHFQESCNKQTDSPSAQE